MREGGDLALFLGDVGVFDELLGDGRAALSNGEVCYVLPDGPANSLQIYAPVIVGPVILDSDHRTAQARIDLVETHDEAVLNAGQLVHDATDGIVDDRGLGQLGGRVLIKLGQVLEDHRRCSRRERERRRL